MIRIHSLLSMLLATCVVGAGIGVANAQDDPQLVQLMQTNPPRDSGTLPFPMGYVDLANGNLHLDIPLQTYAGPKGHSVATTLTYDSRFWMNYIGPWSNAWEDNATWADDQRPHYGGGWVENQKGSITPNIAVWQMGEVVDQDCGYNPVQGDYDYNIYDTTWSNLTYSDSSGTHAFPISFQQEGNCLWQINGPPGPTVGAYAYDGSGYYAIVGSDNTRNPEEGLTQIWAPDGTLVYVSSQPSTVVLYPVDSNGTSPISTIANDSTSPYTPPGVAVTFTSFYVNTDFAIVGINGVLITSEAQGQETLIQSITLANGDKYSFTYDQCPGITPCSSTDYHYGVLTSMTLPTGGILTFHHQAFPPTPGLSLGDSVGDVRTTSVSMSGEVAGNCALPSATIGSTWLLCYQPFSSNWQGMTFASTTIPQTIITAPPDPLGNKSLSLYGMLAIPANVYGAVRDALYKATYSTAGAATPVETVQYAYDQSYQAIRSIVTQRDGITISNTVFGYWSDSIPFYNQAPLPMVSKVASYDASGTNILREKDLTYSPVITGGSTHYIDRPLSVAEYGVGGASGNPVGGAILTYDSTALTTTSGVSGQSVLGLGWHDDTNFGAGMNTRGNLTQVQQMISPGSYSTTATKAYNILGQLVKTTDGNGNPTQFDYYPAAWGDASCAAISKLFFQTQVQNALNQSSQMSYNSCDGSAQSSKNPNDLASGTSGTSYIYDVVHRPLSVTYPDGGGVTTTYSNPNTVNSTQVATPDPSIEQVKLLDGFGRPIRSQSLASYVDTTYDLLGRVWRVTNPYLSGSGTAPYTEMQYDALNRPVLRIDPDGTTTKSNYAGLVTTITDPVGVRTEQTMDMLGQLVQVRELGTVALPLNLTTTYSYDGLGNLTGVTQSGAPGDIPRIRSFSYDSMSRLICASNPENSSSACPASGSSGSSANGVTLYSYDLDGNLSSKTSPLANATSGMQTINYSYDALNRLVQKGSPVLPAASTPKYSYSCYQYDTTSNLAASSMGNFIGRLTNSWTQVSTTPPSSFTCPSSPPGTGALTGNAILAYDAMGRVSVAQQCVLTMCNTNSTPFQLSQKYDLAGDPTTVAQSAIQGMVPSLELAHYYDGAGRLKNIESSWDGHPNSSDPLNIFSVQSYSPAGGLQNWMLGNYLNFQKLYDSRNRPTSMVVTHP